MDYLGDYVGGDVAEQFVSTSSVTMVCWRKERNFFFLLCVFFIIYSLFFLCFQSCCKGYSLHDYKLKNTQEDIAQMLTSKPMYKENKFWSSFVATPLWAKCEDETHTPKSGNFESSETPKNLEFEFRGQNTLHWGVLYTIEKVVKCRCPKWPCMIHLDICSTSYGQKKGRGSNWQFDSRPLKVGNQLNPSVCRWSATHCWKALNERYNFGWNLVPIRTRGEKLWTPKVPGVQIGTISGLHFGSPRKKSHLDVASAQSCREYYKGEGGGFPRVRAVVNQVCPSARDLSQHPRVVPNVN
jgi:hypothetical protein